jgi:hypothetical protein
VIDGQHFDSSLGYAPPHRQSGAIGADECDERGVSAEDTILAAVFAAPPSSCYLRVLNTGTGASGEIRLQSPISTVEDRVAHYEHAATREARHVGPASRNGRTRHMF